MLIGTRLMLAQLLSTITPTTPTPTEITNQSGLSPGNDITSTLLTFTLILLICGIALFTWMMKTGRLRLVTRYSIAPGEVPSRAFSQDQRNYSRVSPGAVELYPPTPIDGETPYEPLKNRQWLNLVKECVAIYDELSTLMPNLDPARQEMAEHVQSRLEEILVRSGVEVIANDRTFDSRRHKLAVPGPSVAPMTRITETVSPGFAVKQLVLRPAQVRVTPAMKE